MQGKGCGVNDTGGPAFPHPSGASGWEGMTLLDYFAGQALPSAINSIIVAAEKGIEVSNPDPAIMAYQIADQMIAEKRRRETADQQKEGGG